MKNTSKRKVVNVDKPNHAPIFEFKQLDNVVLKLSLFKDSVEFDITGQTLKLGAKTNDGLKEQTEGFTINKNNLDIDLKNSILVPGEVEIDLELKDVNGAMTTASFFIIVKPKVLNDKAVEGTNEFDTFTKTAAKIEEDYKGLRRIIIDENQAANLQDQVNQTNAQLETKANAGDIQYLRPEWSKFWNENDCSDAIEDCINKLNGGVIKFSNKTYNISRPIDVKGGIRLEGTGVNTTASNGSTIIKLKDNSNCSMIRTPGAKNNDGDNSAIHYFEIDHIQFNGNGNNQTIDNIALDLQAVYIMTKLSFVNIFNNRGTSVSLSYGCDIQIDHLWINGTIITENDRYAFEFNEKRVEGGQSGMMNINHLYVENTSNKIGGNPKLNPLDRGNAVLLNKVYTANINEFHIEGATIPITIGKDCFTILLRKLSFANCGNVSDSENTLILLTNNINHLKIDDMRVYNCVNTYNVKKKIGFSHNNFRNVPKAENLSYEVIGYNMQPKYQPSTVYTDNIGVNLIENTKPLNIPLQHNDKGINIKHDTSTNPKIYVTTNVNRDNEKEMFYYNSYGNDNDSFGVEAPIILYEKGESTAIPNGSICLKSAVPTTRINGVIQSLVSIRTYTGTPGGGGIKPQFIGQVFIDTTNNKVYMAKGIESTSDWILLN